MGAIEIYCLGPGAFNTMFVQRYRGIDNFAAHSGHDANLEYRRHGAALLFLQAAQDTFDLTVFVQLNLFIGFVFALLL